MRAAKHFLTINHMETLYYSMIHPYLDYGALLWGSASTTNIKPIEILQKKAIRIITNSSYNTHTKPLFKKLRILAFHDMHKLHIDKFMYEYTHNILPNSFSNMFEYNHQIHSHNTRQRNQPHITNRKTAMAGKYIYLPGPQIMAQHSNYFKRI